MPDAQSVAQFSA